MKSPFTGKEMNIVKQWRTMSFRKDEFKVLIHAYKCEDTGEQFEDDAFAQLNYNQLINQYREKHAVPFPDQIIAIREKYDLSAAKMSEILGFGINSFRQYESGEVPNLSNAKLLQLANDPHEFRKLIKLSGTLDQKVIDKTSRTIEKLIEKQKNEKFEMLFENYTLGSSLPNLFTGFKTPSIAKLSEMVVFFAEKLQPWKTKMNKLLFYSDFSMFKQSGFSISGAKYRAVSMGPAPKNFHSIFEFLANKDEVDICCTEFRSGGIGEQFKPIPGKRFNAKLFTEDELQVLDSVAKRFKETSTSEIIDISHEEKAWIENRAESNFIDYNYSFELN